LCRFFIIDDQGVAMTTEVAKIFKYIRLLVITLVVGRSLYSSVFTPPALPPALLTPATLPADYSVPLAIASEQLQIVTLDPTHLTGRFSLILFDNTTHVALVDRVEEHGPGNFVWVGHLSGEQDSQIRVTVADQTMSGFIALKNVRYELQQLHDNFYALYAPDALT
jgi:hypothetical protein